MFQSTLPLHFSTTHASSCGKPTAHALRHSESTQGPRILRGTAEPCTQARRPYPAAPALDPHPAQPPTRRRRHFQPLLSYSHALADARTRYAATAASTPWRQAGGQCGLSQESAFTSRREREREEREVLFSLLHAGRSNACNTHERVGIAGRHLARETRERDCAAACLLHAGWVKRDGPATSGILYLRSAKLTGILKMVNL